MIEAKFIFGNKIELRELETLPEIGNVVSGPGGEPWVVVGRVTLQSESTLTCRPADKPNLIHGDANFPIKS